MMEVLVFVAGIVVGIFLGENKVVTVKQIGQVLKSINSGIKWIIDQFRSKPHDKNNYE